MSDDLVREKRPSLAELVFEPELHFCFGRQFGKSEAIINVEPVRIEEIYKFYRALGSKRCQA